jgi:ParB family chromosome partitioning protein
MAKSADAVVGPKQELQKSIFKDLKLESLIESRRNPRKDFDATSMGDLVESVKRYGVLTPLIVRPVGNDGKYEILAGARRSRAAKAAGLDAVPCRVVEVENDTALEVVVVDNLQRKDIHPLEEAEGFSEILEVSNGDMDGLCAKVGKKATYVTKRLVLLKLLDKGKKLFIKGQISEQHAMMIARLQAADQKAAIEYVAEQDVSVYGLRDWIESEVLRDLSKVSFSKTDAQLVSKAGACDKCPKRTSVSRDLFDDIKQGDRCTDGECFKGKMRAHIDNLQKSLEAAGNTVFGLWESYHGEAKQDGVLKVGEWAEIKKNDFCEKVAKGVFIEGQRAGHFIDICSGRNTCKIHGFTGSSGKTDSEREKTRKLNLKSRIERETRARILRLIFTKQGLLDEKELRMLCAHSFERLWHGSKISLVKAIGWELKKHKEYGSFDFRPVEKKIEGLSTGESAQFMTAVICAGELDPNHLKPEHLAHFAKENKVEWKEIEKVVTSELTKRAPKAKAVKSKATAKRGAKPPVKPKEVDHDDDLTHSGGVNE